VQVTELRSDLKSVEVIPMKEPKKGPLETGDYVRIRQGGATGIVETIDKNKAIVAVGHIRMTVALRDLSHAREPLDVRSSVSIQSDTISQNAEFDSKLDIRGMNTEDAIKVLQDFLDRALLTSTNNLRIVHGKGTGVLRNVVRRKLQEYREVKRAYHPAEDGGGDGVTVVEF
jgi:DNA mismatch repair protein MutS2